MDENSVELRVEIQKDKDGNINMRFMDQQVGAIRFYPVGKSGAQAYGKLNGILQGEAKSWQPISERAHRSGATTM